MVGVGLRRRLVITICNEFLTTLISFKATWDAPPLPSEPGYVEFEQAFKRFLEARKVFIVKKSRKDTVAFDNRPKAAFDRRELALTADPELGQEGKLMEFQVSVDRSRGYPLHEYIFIAFWCQLAVSQLVEASTIHFGG